MPRRRVGQLGRKPLRRAQYARALPLSRVLTGTLPAHPAQQDYLARLSGWQMLGNDNIGDCVAVWWANTRRLVTSALIGEEHYPKLNQVLDVYRTQNPRYPAQDDGMIIQDLLKYLVDHGGPDGVKALAYAKVDHTNADEVKAAIALFGSICVGVWVSEANEDQFADSEPWDYVKRSANLGGHCVIVGGYDSDQQGVDEKIITWAEETGFTDDFWAHQVDEAWVVIWPEHVMNRAFQEGVDLTELATAYTELTGRPFPVVHVPPEPPQPPAPVADDADRRLAAAVDAWKAAKGLT